MKRSLTGSESNEALLGMMDDMAHRLRKKKMDVEAIGCLEQGLMLKRRLLGREVDILSILVLLISQSPDVHKALTDVVVLYNQVAMESLASSHDQCLTLLKKAELLATSAKFSHTESLRILTYNNMGCCYRRLGKLKHARQYLHEAAAIGAETTHVKNLSITFLNLCAIESQLDRHESALEHAQSAIFHAQEELVVDQVEDDDAADVLDAKTKEEKIVALAIAYHNMAVELEHNGRADASLQWYKKALQMVFKYKESNADLWHTFKTTFDAAKAKQTKHETTSSRHTPAFTFEHSRIATSTSDPTSRPRAASKPPSTAANSLGPAQTLYKKATSTAHPKPPSTKPARPTSARPRARAKTPKRPPQPPPPSSSPVWFDDDEQHDESLLATSPLRIRRHDDPATHAVQSKSFRAFLRSKAATAAPPTLHIAPVFGHTRPRSAKPSRLRVAVAASRSPQDEDDVLEVFDDDDDVVQVFASPPKQATAVDTRHEINPPAPRVVDVPSPQAELVPERVSHLEYLKRLKKSIDNTPPSARSAKSNNPAEITRQHRLALELDRIRRVASTRVQAVARGFLVRRRYSDRSAHLAKEHDAARLIQARLRGANDRQRCLMKMHMQDELERIRSVAAVRIQATA
ncbi:hypothetical protein As57867_013061, partial [Aphanomyces stellatus]